MPIASYCSLYKLYRLAHHAVIGIATDVCCLHYTTIHALCTTHLHWGYVTCRLCNMLRNLVRQGVVIMMTWHNKKWHNTFNNTRYRII